MTPVLVSLFVHVHAPVRPFFDSPQPRFGIDSFHFRRANLDKERSDRTPGRRRRILKMVIVDKAIIVLLQSEFHHDFATVISRQPARVLYTAIIGKFMTEKSKQGKNPNW